MMVNARRDGLVKRFCPWESYVEPLLDHSQAAMKSHPDVQFRLYLANDARSMLLPADVEYALQANWKSEIVYF